MAVKRTPRKSTGRNIKNTGIEAGGSLSIQDFPVIGIGASAGGLDAFGKFFSAMPSDTPMAFVVIQHLDPSHASNMAELLQRFTAMPVHEATEKMNLEPGHVYMIPPNRDMTVKDRTLMLTEQVERPGIVHSIDLFFRSLAEDLKEKAICIILSGTGTDGTLGAKAVKADFGMVMVQDPETAAYDGMPLAAITSGVADFILPPEKMPEQLVKYVRTSYGKRGVSRHGVKRDFADINYILSLILARTKHDFSGYKQSTVNRRIDRRMGINQIDNAGEYLKFLREHPAELDALVKDFLINVTSFFRDPEAFTALKDDLKELLKDKAEGSEIRAWIPGCSTGEEAYSIVITIEEALEELKKYCLVQVFATDLDNDAIAAARKGVYPASIGADVGQDRLKKFFTAKDEKFQINRELREKLVFAVQDVITDPPFTRMDLISARNLLIYFDADLQKRLIPMFHYALNPDGLLFLGTAESVGEFAELFAPVDKRWKIYRAKRSEKRSPFTLSQLGILDVLPQTKTAEHDLTSEPARSPEQVLLEALPASVLLDRNYHVLFVHGDTRKYLGLPEGKPNTDILQTARPEIRTFLSTALHKTAALGQETTLESGQIKLDGQTQSVKVRVKPVISAQLDEMPGRLIVTFYDVPPAKRTRKNEAAAGDARSAELEQELQLTKETLQGTIEELQTANEELRSANEEYQSTNEELQSTNEELETSREELQSVNEELSIVNTEFQAKIDELSSVNDDMKNLLNSIPIATIYLDNALKIQRFTPAATKVFNLIATDVDRPISHITSQIGEYDITGKAKGVLDTLIPVQESIQTRDGKWYSMRLLPYRTTDNAIAGVLVTFVDISEQERTNLALSYAEDVIDTLPLPVLVLDKDLKVISANRAYYESFKATRHETEHKPVFDAEKCSQIQSLRKFIKSGRAKNKEVKKFLLECDFSRTGLRKLEINARRLKASEKDVERILLSMVDVSREGNGAGM